MSYNNTSYYKSGGPVSGMSRGRGYSSAPMRGGGSVRGRGSSDGSSWRGRGRGYGVHSSRGGVGSSSMVSNSSNYNSSSSSSGNWYNKDSSSQGYRSDRYISGSRPGDTRYQSTRGSSVDHTRRYSRQDAPSSYSSREHHRSPEVTPRKRIRSDGYPPAAGRRSHEGGSSYDYSSSRYEYGSEKSSYSSEERTRPMYREERPRGPSADRRDEYHSPRSREPSGSSMPPPSAPVRGSSFRMRTGVRYRGVSRVYTRRPIDVSSLAARKRTLVESYAKRRILSGRTDYLKKLKSIKMRSAAILSSRREGIKEEHGDSEEEVENWDDEDEGKELISESTLKRKNEDEDEDDESKKPKKVIRKIIKKVVRKKTAGPVADAESEESKDASKEGGADKDDVDDRSADVEEEEEVIEEEEVEVGEEVDEPKMQVTIKQDSETRAVSDEGGRKIVTGKGGYRYIRLFCPHCKERYITFKDYQLHLRGVAHVTAMRKLSLRLKQNLARMRVEQRIKQRQDEKNDEVRGVVGGRTNFCPTCKLNYRQERARHIESEMHKKMKEFLMPYCVICRISFKSPMLFENHICSLDHIKIEEQMLRGGRDRGEHHAEKEVDMDSLLVLDSVGSADESESDEEAEDEKTEDKDGEKKEKKKKKAQINLGADYVKKVEVMYCELCAIYLPRTGDQDVALANHCRTRNHLQRYVRYRDDRALRKEAERIHRRDKAEQEARHKAQEENKDENNESTTSDLEKSVSKDDDGKNEKSSGAGNAGTGTEGGSEGVDLDDKIWADVDKGLDELLREVEPGNKSSDDDDESGRYDRFRYSDKKGGKVSSDGIEADNASASNLPSSVESSVKQEQVSTKEKS